MDDIRICDPHQHFWDIERNYYPWLCDDPMVPFRYKDYSAIRRTYMPEDYFRDTAGHNVALTVHVEADWDPADPVGETRWLMQVREKYGYPHGIVAQAWPARDDVAEVLKAQADFPLVSGIRNRPVPARSPDAVVRGAPGTMDDPNYRAGIALLDKHRLSFDLITPYWHMAEAADLARDFPDTQMILNHTGALSDLVFETEAGFKAWREAMQMMADRPNVAIKISGLGVAGRPWTIDDYRTVILDTIDIFGVDRCMFASNYPVDSLVADFDAIYSGFKAVVADFPRGDQEKLFCDNAARFYRLSG